VPAPLQHPAGLGLELHDLLVTFAEHGGATRAVLDVREFTVTGARQIAVCGPSGSGKTTLLNVLAGLLRPQRGSVHWAAVQVTALSEPALDRWRRDPQAPGRFGAAVTYDLDLTRETPVPVLRFSNPVNANGSASRQHGGAA